MLENHILPTALLLLEYPSRQHFLSKNMSEKYRHICSDRTVALAYGGLDARTTNFTVWDRSTEKTEG